MKDKFIFFCFPGIGIIEQWLPVLSELKKKEQKLTFFFLKPHIYINLKKKITFTKKFLKFLTIVILTIIQML